MGKEKKSEEKLGGKKLNKLLHLVWVGTPLASEENQPVQRLGRHSGLRFSRLRPLQKSSMALTPPESPRFPATTNFRGIWLLVAAVDSGLLELVLPAASSWTEAPRPPGRWCPTGADLLGFSRVVDGSCGAKFSSWQRFHTEDPNTLTFTAFTQSRKEL